MIRILFYIAILICNLVTIQLLLYLASLLASIRVSGVPFIPRLLQAFRIGPKRNEVTGEWRKLHNEELCDLYPSPRIIRIIKLRRMRWAGHVARMGEKRKAYR
jgi:hypothetical protein